MNCSYTPINIYSISIKTIKMNTWFRCNTISYKSGITLNDSGSSVMDNYDRLYNCNNDDYLIKKIIRYL